MRFTVLSCILAFLTACSNEAPPAAQDKAKEPAGSAASAEDAPITSLGEGQSAWTFQAHGSAGATLSWSQTVGMPALHIACRNDPAELAAELPQVKRIGSEERLTLGAGPRLAALVVGSGISAGEPVRASGPLELEFVEALGGAKEFAASYGAVQVGPARAPRPEVLVRFAAACRAALGPPDAAQ